uniref:HicB_like antitoxin of toxin-antitoxin system n=1 Tax=Candidatus Kentrum sp. SD TaxID=2126332 RepID=A0A450YS71_9GAMM|nr:MAG: Uncharacterised protein family (UPF0150) [Candidatus Kentron sp. SD]VFK44388.1 MAG: Uncharacterised protein family (UPF0150) [Candidatus Kentron sp. SD]
MKADIRYSYRGYAGCISEGDTEDQVLTNIREAIELYFEPIDDDNISCNEGARKVELVI